MPLRVAFDMDGVIADFRSAFKAIVRTDPARTGPGEDLLEDSGEDGSRATQGDLKRAWRQIVNTPNWWTTLAPYEPDQIGRLYRLARRSRWEVFFVTKRPATRGETVQYQTQWWLEAQGYLLPSVVTIPGSRGELASALRLDVLIDDQLLNCIEVISASPAKAVLLLRDPRKIAQREDALQRGIGAVSTLEESLDVLEHLEGLLRESRGAFLRLADWFKRGRRQDPSLPDTPREERPLPPLASE